jgi:hypothetical protein
MKVRLGWVRFVKARLGLDYVFVISKILGKAGN